jgi:long-chain acyl-CoA synthetase
MLTGNRRLRDLEALLTGNSAGPAPPGADAPITPGDPDRAGARHAPTAPARSVAPITFPSWNRSGPAWLLRRVSLPTWILPLGHIHMKLRVEGLDHFATLKGPVLFAANHQSHMDAPAILMALPSAWRYRTAIALAKVFFTAHFSPAGRPFLQRLKGTTLYLLSCQFFNAFPLPQREAGTRQTLRYVGEVAADGYSVLIFPEGRRTEDGQIDRFQPGVGMMGAKLALPVVPVRLDGLDRVLGKGMTWPVRGPVRVAFGAPLHLTGNDYPALARQVEAAVRDL